MPVLEVIIVLVIVIVAYGVSKAARRTVERTQREASDGIAGQRRRMEEEKRLREEERKRRETCPYCGTRIQPPATECKRCGAAQR